MALNLPMPPWHLIYPRGSNVTVVTLVIVAYATAALAAKRRAAAAAKAKAQESLLFEDGASSSDLDSVNADAVCIEPPSIGAPAEEHLNYISATVWGKPSLRPRQMSAVKKLLPLFRNTSKGRGMARYDFSQLLKIKSNNN